MAKNKDLSKKLRLGKQGRRTRWTPFWVIPKALGKGKRVHPSRLTRVKRHWRRNNIKRDIKRQEKRTFKPDKKKKKY